MKDPILLNKLLSQTNKRSGVYGADGNFPTQCWEWSGGTSCGYGIIWDTQQKKILKTHRVSYALYVQDPRSKCVLHKCDNRLCVRPSHLFLGTRQDNVRDMDSKSRRVSVTKEQHGRSKLTTEQVHHIRNIYPSKSYGVLAQEYDVSRAAIRNVIKKRTWQ